VRELQPTDAAAARTWPTALLSMHSSTARLFLLLGAFAPAAASDLAPAADPPRRSRPAWQSKLTTYSIASVARREGRRDWNEVTQGNKVVLPREAYDVLTSRGLPIDKFQLLNPERKQALRLFTGPLDFCAPSGECYLPSWVMRQLGIKEGEMCAVATASFPAAAFVKFQPHSSDFLDIGDHTAVLTRTIENLGGLTQGSYVRVSDGKKTYTLDVLEVRGKPMASGLADDSGGKAVSIGLMECPIEFAEPKDIAKKAKKKPAAAEPAADASGAADAAADAASEAPGGEAASADPKPTSAAAARRAAQGGSSGKSSSSGKGSSGGGADSGAASAPVPKFKRRKAAAAGEAEALNDSPFAGRARSLGSSSSEAEAEGEAEAGGAPASALKKARIAAKRKAAAEGEGADADADAEGVAADVASAGPPGLVLILAKALEMLRTIFFAVLKAVRKLLTPDAVSFD